MRDAQTISGLLLAHGAVAKSRIPELLDPLLRGEVERRLSEVGLELASSAYSDHYGVRLLAEPNALREEEQAGNHALNSDHHALLVILWTRLVSAKRMEGQELPQRIHVNSIWEEFKDKFQSGSALKLALGRLRSLGFVEVEAEWVLAGPNLELCVDADRMADFIRKRAAVQAAADRARQIPDAAKVEDPTRPVLVFLERSPEPLLAIEIRRALSMDKKQVDTHLKSLRQRGLIKTEGERARTRYFVPRTPGGDT